MKYLKATSSGPIHWSEFKKFLIMSSADQDYCRAVDKAKKKYLCAHPTLSVNPDAKTFFPITVSNSELPAFEHRKEALAIRHVFSLVDMITNTKFSNCTLVFKIGAVRQQNMQCKHQNTFQSNLSLAKK